MSTRDRTNPSPRDDDPTKGGDSSAAGPPLPSWPGAPGEPTISQSGVATATAETGDEDAVSEGRATELLEEFEGEAPTRKLEGRTQWLVGALAAGLSLYAIYWVVG